MPLILVSHTTRQVEGVTRKDLLDRFLRETGLGKSGTVGDVDGGGTTTFDDPTTLKSSQFNSSEWVGGWFRCSKDAGGASAAPENEQSPITTYDPTTNGRVTFNPALTAALVATDSYQLWRFPDPTIVREFLDQILKNDIYLPYWSLLSEIPDFDMEQASASADWTASNATVTKVTQTNEAVTNSKRALSIATTSAGGYARTATIHVEPNKRYHLSAKVRVNAASITPNLIAYDVTNSATIDSKSSIRQYATRIWFEFTTPSTCYQMQVRLSNTENSVTSIWDDVVLYPIDSGEISLPWWVKNKQQVKGIFELRAEQITTNVWDTTLRGEPVTNDYVIQDSAFGKGGLSLVKTRGTIGGPLFIFGIRNEEAYSSDTLDSKRVDENLLFTCLAYKVFSHLRQLPNSGVLDSQWIRAQAAEYEKQYIKAMRQQAERLEEVIQSYPAEALYGSDHRFRWD